MGGWLEYFAKSKKTGPASSPPSQPKLECFSRPEIEIMPTPLEDLKIHMNVPADDTADDLALQQKLDVATAWVGRMIGSDVHEGSPAPVHEAARMLAAHLFENREATLVGVAGQELPFGVLDMLEPYRAWY